MANMKFTIDHTLRDGEILTLKAPCNCTAVAGVKIYYPDASGNTVSKVFSFYDSHLNALTGIGHLFMEGAYIVAVFDTKNSRAFILNADTNKYIEQGFRPASWTPTAAEVGARPASWTPTAEQVGARPASWTPTAEQVGAVPENRKVNSKPLSADVTLNASDVGAMASSDKTALEYAQVTLAASGWTGSGPYTQTINVSGMTASWIPGIPSIVPGSTVAADLAAREALACVTKITSQSGKLVFSCYEEKPTANVTIRIPGLLA